MQRPVGNREPVPLSGDSVGEPSGIKVTAISYHSLGILWQASGITVTAISYHSPEILLVSQAV